jgi:hypothetical protein
MVNRIVSGYIPALPGRLLASLERLLPNIARTFMYNPDGFGRELPDVCWLKILKTRYQTFDLRVQNGSRI